jgi:ubiquinone biosynthesis monooxygenase Coq7
MTTALDTALNAADGALRTLFATPRASRTCPTVPGEKTELATHDKSLSGALMRVNHVGEVCAKALYAAQALGTRDAALREHFLQASREEGDHLAWTKTRLDELGARLLDMLGEDGPLRVVQVEDGLHRHQVEVCVVV